jgi:amidase
VQSRIFRDFNALFDHTDIIVAPATAVSPFPHSQGAPTQIGDQAMPTYMRWLAVVYGFTMALACVACIPCGRDANGLPFGIQVAGRRGDDARVLAVASALEARFASDPELARALPPLERLTMSQPEA